MSEQTIFLAGGCFWGISEYFSRIPGIISTVAGYANSKIPSPSYEKVKDQSADAAETVEITFDDRKLSLEQILHAFFLVIDPLSLNRQGADSGRSYRTGIYYQNDKQKETAAKSLQELESKLGKKSAVELLPLENFYKAEEYHQDYLKKHPDGYCHVNFAKLRLFKDELLKTDKAFENWVV